MIELDRLEPTMRRTTTTTTTMTPQERKSSGPGGTFLSLFFSLSVIYDYYCYSLSVINAHGRNRTLRDLQSTFYLGVVFPH